jgi:hypothetical protein
MDTPIRTAPADAVPFTGLDRLGGAVRRTALQRRALALLAVALLAAAVLVARSLGLPAEALVPQGQSGIIALDLSRSMTGSRLDETAQLLKRFAVPGQRVGLVVFSDAGYELLPPGSPGTELQPLIDLFTPFRPNPLKKKLYLHDTPWDPTFRAGTVVSTGLAAARRAAERHGTGPTTILLVSDLSTLPDDLPRVADELVAMKRDRMTLRIVAPQATEGDRAVFERLAGGSAFVPPSSLGRGGLRSVAAATLREPVPGTLVVLALALLVVLGLNELWCGRLLGVRAPARGDAA